MLVKKAYWCIYESHPKTIAYSASQVPQAIKTIKKYSLLHAISDSLLYKTRLNSDRNTDGTSRSFAHDETPYTFAGYRFVVYDRCIHHVLCQFNVVLPGIGT